MSGYGLTSRNLLPGTILGPRRPDENWRIAQAPYAESPERVIGQANPNNPPVRFFYYHLDHLGTPRVITDINGHLVEQHKYLPFGEELNAPTGMNSHQFTGHERDGETGLDYMLARYYGAGIGRFASPDPVAGYAEYPQTLNRYVYAANNPLNFIDPDGRDFTLSCEDESDSCHGGQQGKWNKDKEGNNTTFEPTVISSDPGGNLHDQDGNAYSGSFDGEQVQFTDQASGQPSEGEWLAGSNSTTFTQQSGALDGFSLTFTEPQTNERLRGSFLST